MTAPMTLALAAALALTACQPHAPEAAAAQVACERLVTQDPDAAFEHVTTTREDGRWTVAGVVTIGDSAEQYKCRVEVHDDGGTTGDVYYVTE